MKQHTAKRRVRAILTAAAALGAMAVLAAGPSAAGSYTMLAPDLAVGGPTQFFDINDAGYITGSAGGHGFIRSPTGAYTLFDNPTGFNTAGRGIDDANNIVGYAMTGAGANATNADFYRSAAGVITPLTNPTDGSDLHGIPEGLNASGVIVGDYYHLIGMNTVRDGYILDGGQLTTLRVPDPSGFTPFDETNARGINDAGLVVGWTFSGVTGVVSGFTYDAGAYTVFDDPEAVAAGGDTYFQDVNDSGIVSGQWIDQDDVFHPFLYDIPTGQFTDLDPHGDLSAGAFGINNLGQVVVGDYLYDPATVPEPGAWALMLTGLAGLGGALRAARRPIAGLR